MVLVVDVELGPKKIRRHLSKRARQSCVYAHNGILKDKWKKYNAQKIYYPSNDIAYGRPTPWCDG